ncbi:MAG: hypothetical protein FJ297_03870 [Planctomycetes bacterium]|nr:hypothetical protein [Planctomycetota bacterium]
MSNELTGLRLHSVEHFMLADSRDSHPTTFFLRLELSAELDLERLRSAVDRCVRWHPLLSATIRPCRRTLDGARWQWMVASRASWVTPTVEQHVAGGYTTSRGDWSFDLRREAGLRLSLCGRELWIQGHHVCCDGRGMFDFLCDLQSEYGSPSSSAEVDARAEGAIGQLRRRAIGFSPNGRAYWNWRSPNWARIAGYFRHRSQPLASTAAGARRSTAFHRRESTGDRVAFAPAYVRREIPLCATRWHERAATAPETDRPTLNDYLLQAVFSAMAEHQQAAGLVPRNAWLRIGMPIDMRSPADRITTAINASSLVFLDRRPNQILDPRSTWRDELVRETRRIKRHRLGVVFFDFLEAVHRLPWGMRWATADRRRAVSAVVSNLGPLHFPDPSSFTIEQIDALPPLRPGTRMALGVVTLRNRLGLTLHFDGRQIAPASAEAFLERVTTQMAVPR